MYDKVRADEKVLEQAKLELERREIELESREERLLQAKGKLTEAIEKHKGRIESTKIAAEHNEKLVQQAVQKRDSAEAKVLEASVALQSRDVAIARPIETNTKLTVVVASLSREKDSLMMRPPRPSTPQLPMN
ncbi:hypothetical protein V501_09187, partial [Pseudogymnoascus sp. VKM F-4519 (FW-2642)]